MLYSALLGKPVDHSVSPELFRMLGEQFGFEYGHIKINVESKKILPQYLAALETLGFCGVNITLPYKIDVMKFIDEFDESAIKCGAVNTIKFKGPITKGYNTDAFGAIKAIEKKLKPIRCDEKVCVIGAGGAARAVIFEVYKRTRNLSIINIDTKQAKEISRDISGSKIEYFELNDKNMYKLISESNFIINTTPVGMSPNFTKSIVSQNVLDKFKSLKGKYFFDAIFNPYKTKFLSDVEAKGATVCSGMYWMVFQAAAASKIWIGKDFSETINADEISKSLAKFLK
ncbi:MAG: shikimate dehydrogenase [Candidatus Berkelbacteria bacterium]|nr:shikimate dehydrogenase [Candidatus Berkelbacteria bacterium]